MSKVSKKSRKYWIIGFVVVVVGGTVFHFTRNSGAADQNNFEHVVVAELGTVISRALAVGHIEPEQEIQVKSKISGVVDHIYAEPGSFVKRGDPLIEVRPDPTPLEMAEARRSLERTQLEKSTIKRELDRLSQLRSRNLIADQEYDHLLQRYEDVKIRAQMNRERLELLESGRVVMGTHLIESVIRAPIDGYILERFVDVGEPVVPLTSYQAGTPLMTIANMDNLLFKGTVDEIDVGKLSEGMHAELKIGALPGVVVEGVLTRISLKARNQNNTTVFPVEISIIQTNGTTLRAGFSANADIIIDRREQVITIPERVVTFRDGKTFVEVAKELDGEKKEREVRLGLSDAITVEVVDGLKEGDTIFEKPLRRLTVR